MLMVLASICLFWQPSVSQETKWVSAYYAGWWQGSQLNPDEIDYSAVTHILHFAISPNSDGTFSGEGNGLTHENIISAVHAAHAAQKKIILSVGGASTDAVFAGAVSPGNRARFIRALVEFMNRYNYDGIDVDWEPVNTKTHYLTFIKELRQAMTAAAPGSELLTAVMTGTDPNLLARAARYFDQINIMTYDMAGPWGEWVTWHNTALYDGGYTFPSTGGPVPSADRAVEDQIRGGVPPHKIGVGIDFYGYRWWGGTGTTTGGVTRPRQTWDAYPNVRDNVPYFELMDAYARYPVTWDSIAKAAYIGIDRPGSENDEFISLDNEQTVASKADYVRKKGLGGVIVFELGGGYRRSLPPTYRDVLLQTVRHEFFGGEPPHRDLTSPIIQFESPGDADVLFGEAGLGVIVSDNVALGGVVYRIDGSDIGGGSIRKAPFVTSLNTWRFDNGSHLLGALAYDVFGNRAEATVSVTIRNKGTAPVPPARIVFDDRFDPAFSNTSWGANVSFDETFVVKSGSQSIRVEYMAWGAFDVLSGTWGRQNPIDPSEYGTMTFDAYPLSDLNVKVGFYNNYSKSVTLEAENWNSVSVPLTFSQPFTRFYIQSDINEAVTCFFDNIRFSAKTYRR
jgi:chitinase